jgi:hypothetical protein
LEDCPKTQSSWMCPKVVFFGEGRPTNSTTGERVPAERSDQRVGFDGTTSNPFQLEIGDGPHRFIGLFSTPMVARSNFDYVGASNGPRPTKRNVRRNQYPKSRRLVRYVPHVHVPPTHTSSSRWGWSRGRGPRDAFFVVFGFGIGVRGLSVRDSTCTRPLGEGLSDDLVEWPSTRASAREWTSIELAGKQLTEFIVRVFGNAARCRT